MISVTPDRKRICGGQKVASSPAKVIGKGIVKRAHGIGAARSLGNEKASWQAGVDAGRV